MYFLCAIVDYGFLFLQMLKDIALFKVLFVNRL